SAEVASSLVVLFSLIVLFLTGAYIFKEIVRVFLILTGYASGDIPSFGELFSRLYTGMLKLLIPLFLVSLGVAVLAHVAQFGFIFTLKPLSFKLERINPFEGIKRLFSVGTLFEMAKSTLKALLLIGVALFLVSGSIDFFVSSPLSPPERVLVEFLKKSAGVLIALGAVAFLISLVDYAFRRWQYERKIMMSRRELKEEYKQLEGHPEVKGRLRARMRELARSRMMAEVPKASVIITNPTHIAIALRYDPKKDRAPVVVAKGKGRVAEKIVEIGRAHGVPVVRKPELARALYPAVEVGKEISPKFYKAVAEVIAYVMFKRKKLYA
ncbi:MAG: flagellar biosynthesis protein FlhB, partial [Aquificae bacterium]|nr:flagellar biosynthesis protein FlhB [Aquificota bacterium]